MENRNIKCEQINFFRFSNHTLYKIEKIKVENFKNKLSNEGASIEFEIQENTIIMSKLIIYLLIK